MKTYTCDHCGLFIYKSDNIYEPNIMWCRPCINQDHKLLDDAGIKYSTIEPQFFWVSQGALDLLKLIPKITQRNLFDYLSPEEPEEETVEEVKVEKKPCARAYYGLQDCTCGTCPPRRYMINKNPFGY